MLTTTQHSVPIVVNVYDLEPQINELLYSVGLGFYHSGVEILGREYTFAQDHGIIDTVPRAVPNPFRGSLKLGKFTGGTEKLKQALQTLESRFTPTNYEITSNNCNHFSNALVHELTGQFLPPYLNRMAHLGSCIHCLIPRNGNNETHNQNSQSFKPFAGRGHTLDATPPSSMIITDTTSYNNTSTRRAAVNNINAVADRREAVRAATLLRFGAANSK